MAIQTALEMKYTIMQQPLVIKYIWTLKDKNAIP